MNRDLNVFLHNTLAGKLTKNDAGKLAFIYESSYLEHQYPAISLSLPLHPARYEGKVVDAFFSGLLPDDIVRHRLAKYLGISEKNSFAMLEAIGGECAGALSFYPTDSIPTKPSEGNIEILSENNLKDILNHLNQKPLLAGNQDLRLSLAGAQNKIAVGIKNGKIALIRGTNPTTHILKPMIEDICDSAFNEYFCMRLAKCIGIDTPNVALRWLDNTAYFLVERYDRTNTTGERIHQEDFCQAMGVLPDNKYEREGGPSIAQCLHLLHSHSIKPAADQLSFLKRIIFNYLIGNADAHGKNFSLLYQSKKPELAPAYDLLCTAVYEGITTKMAMKIGGKYKPEDVFMRHWIQMVPDTKLAKDNLKSLIEKTSKDCVEKSLELLASLEEEKINSPILKSICKVISARAKHIE